MNDDTFIFEAYDITKLIVTLLYFVFDLRQLNSCTVEGIKRKKNLILAERLKIPKERAVLKEMQLFMPCLVPKRFLHSTGHIEFSDTYMEH